jgi:hypothetical protein
MAQKDDLKNKVATWLEEQGYPLEMRVASILHNVGFRVVQSEYFVDPDSGDARELDVVAFKQVVIEKALFRISLLIECKRSVDKPWLLFTSDKARLADPARVVQRAANSLGRRFLEDVSGNADVQKLSLLSLPERSAYGVTQAFTTGKDTCYSAVTSVSKATLATVAKLDDRREADSRSLNFFRRERDIFSIVLPVVVVDGKLFEVHLDKSGSMHVDEINSGTLLWRNPVVGMPHTIVNIVSAANFENFSNDARASIDCLFTLAGKQLLESVNRSIEKEGQLPIRIV